MLTDLLTLWKQGSRKALDIAVELGVYDSVEILSSACNNVLKGVEAPVRIRPGPLIKAYLRKLPEGPVKYIVERAESGRIVLWRLTRKSY